MSLKLRVGKLEKALLPTCGDFAAQLAALSDEELVDLACTTHPWDTQDFRREVIAMAPKDWPDDERELYLAGRYDELRAVMFRNLHTREMFGSIATGSTMHCREITAGRQ